jgi:hypothetical protein
MCRRRQLSLYPVLFATRKQNRQLPAASYTQKGMSAGRNGRWQFGHAELARRLGFLCHGVFVFKNKTSTRQPSFAPTPLSMLSPPLFLFSQLLVYQRPMLLLAAYTSLPLLFLFSQLLVYLR